MQLVHMTLNTDGAVKNTNKLFSNVCTIIDWPKLTIWTEKSTKTIKLTIKKDETATKRYWSKEDGENNSEIIAVQWERYSIF